MKIECQLEKIKNAVITCERITGKNLTLPVLSTILLIAKDKSLTLRATNLSIGIEIKVPENIDESTEKFKEEYYKKNYYSNLKLFEEHKEKLKKY